MVTYRAGTFRRAASTLAPLAVDTIRGMLRPPRPDPVQPSWVVGGEPGQLLDASPVDAVGLRGRQTAYRIDYVTRDWQDRQLTATGAIFRSGKNGPLIGFAPSTQGVARHCDPSYSCTVGARGFWPPDLIAAYEQPAINGFLDAGADVVIIDYPRDPELGIQLYCDHQSGANALADAITVARTFGCDGPLGLWGFSQGGGAVGAYLEGEHPESPEAAVVGAPPSRLDDVLHHLDGSMVTGVIAYTVAGLMVTSEEIRAEVEGALTEYGLNELAENLATCTGGSVLTSGWHSTSTWSRSGMTLGAIVEDLPATSAEIRRRQLGQAEPTVPVRLWASRHDDVIPYDAVHRLHRRWPRAEWHPRSMRKIPGRTGLNHFGPYYQWLAEDASWLLGRLR